LVITLIQPCQVKLSHCKSSSSLNTILSSRNLLFKAQVFVEQRGEVEFLYPLKVNVDDCSLGAGFALKAQVKHVGDILEGLWNRIAIELVNDCICYCLAYNRLINTLPTIVFPLKKSTSTCRAATTSINCRSVPSRAVRSCEIRFEL
jgi:hypothetical protein